MGENPWSFGWTQVLTIAGFAITICITALGFRTFGRWKREKVEERRIETAIEALAVAYQSKYVFENIRTPLIQGSEWSSMETNPDHTEEQRRHVGTSYAVLERIRAHKDYFEHLWKLQPQCMAIFGPKIEDTFMLVHKARRHIEVACQMLANYRLSEDTLDKTTRLLYEQLRRDMSDHGDFEPEKDRVGKMLIEFRSQIEIACRPVIDESLKPISYWSRNPLHTNNQ